MPEPSDALRGLAAQGRQLHAQFMAAQRAKQAAPANAIIGTDLLDFFFDLSGYKRAVARVGKGIAYSSAIARESDVLAGYDAWVEGVRSALKSVSFVVHHSEPTARILLRRFSASQRYVRLDTRLEHGVRFLEELADERLVWSEGVPAHRVRAPEAIAPQTPPVPPPTASLFLSERPQMLELLATFPSARQAIEGAFAVYEARTPDFGRQSLNSCRNAIENLTKMLSGEGDWNLGLPKVISSDAERQVVKKAHVFLSAYGTHGVQEPDLATVEMGIGLTFLALKLLLRRGAAQ